MNIILYVTLIVFGIYTFLILSFAYGWKKIAFFKPEKDIRYRPVTVIVACRNEEKNIFPLLECLINQDYPKKFFEIIIVDDHSEDNTLRIAKSFQDNSKSLKLFSLPNHLQGKKAALELGINHVNTEIIITTDADCTMNKHWVKSMIDYYCKHDAGIISGPVIFKCKTLLEKFQALEFLSLMGSGAGAIGINHPIMNNGANLLFEKKLFKKSILNNKFASGDDIFLLLQVKKSNITDIRFIKSVDAAVFTNSVNNLKDFFNQRIRWASKSTGYKDFDIILTALTVSCVNLLLAGTLVCSLFSPHIFKIYLSLFMLKSFADLTLLIPVAKFTGQQRLLLLFIPLQFVYPFYIILTTAFGLIGKFQWKSRIYKEKR